MKKLLLLFTMTTFALTTGCDPSCYYDFYLKNGTDADLIVEVNGQMLNIIRSGGEERIDRLGTHTDNVIDLFSPEEAILTFLELKINNVVMPNSIWKRKYWEYTSSSKSHACYTLTLTDELIETLIIENDLINNNL